MTLPAKNRKYTFADILKLPDFIRAELINGVICSPDGSSLEVDEEVFQTLPSETRHVTYRLSVVSVQEVSADEPI